MALDKKFRLSFSDQAKALVKRLTLEEKVSLMGGNWSLQKMMAEALKGENGSHYNMEPYPAGGIEREGLPPMLFVDGPRGVVCGVGQTTCFPVSMCRGASFDDDLEERVGEAIGEETLAFGGNTFAGVCINLPYHPGWGRSQETYGEESFHIGRMGAALTRGVQSRGVLACVKHFAFNQMENARFKVSVECDKRTEREVFLPHFKACLDAGASAVMSSYNLLRGTHCGHSSYLLNGVLKTEWDFDGFVMSDFIWGVKDTVEAANGGQDMEMCCTQYFGDKLVKAVRDGFVPEARIDDAALRIVRTLLAQASLPAREGSTGTAQHLALAHEAACKGITLLQNRCKALPFEKQATRTVALIGKLADKVNIGDWGSSRVFPAHVSTIPEGLAAVCPGVEILTCDGSDIAAAKALAQKADALVFVVGYDHDDEGEYIAENSGDGYTFAMGGDRRSLSLHQDEIRLIQDVGPLNKNSAVVLIGGNTILISDWMDSVSAILFAYYPGQMGGQAIAEILFGDVNPSGKLPFVLPWRESDLPRVDWDAERQWYNYYHGYAKLDKEGTAPLLPYGFGLSYSEFVLSDAAFAADDTGVSASCCVTNASDRGGDCVLQLYVGFLHSKQDRPRKLLRDFKRVSLKPGEQKRVTLSCATDALRWFDPERGWTLEHMEYPLMIGQSSAPHDCLEGSVLL